MSFILCNDRGIYSCTSNGALRLTTLGTDDVPMSHRLAALPTRLCDWRISSSQETFSYGGDEVELSVWNTEQAFTHSAGESSITEMKKRKRGVTLFPGEVWRAKNVRCILFVVTLTPDVFTRGDFRF